MPRCESEITQVCQHSPENINDDEESQIQAIEAESIGSIRRTIEAGNSALKTAESTISRLQGQGLRLQNTQNKFELAGSHNDLATARTKKLQKLNGGMFGSSRSKLKHGIPVRTCRVQDTKGPEQDQVLEEKKAALNVSIGIDNIDGLSAIEDISNTLNAKAREMRAMVEQQNALIDTISAKVCIAIIFLRLS